jgi:hypothetical protein
MKRYDTSYRTDVSLAFQHNVTSTLSNLNKSKPLKNSDCLSP